MPSHPQNTQLNNEIFMYSEYKDLEKPNNNDKIWRYIDFTEFVYLLDRQSLFFVRVDKLADQFEGSVSKANIELRPKIYKGMPLLGQCLMPIVSKELRKYVLVNSWNISEHESAAMWKTHLKSDEGVAVQSTFGKLCSSFNRHKEDEIPIGKVKYISYKDEMVPENKLISPYMCKRKNFEYEQELRALIMRYPIKDGTIDSNAQPCEEGLDVAVDLDILIDKIFISPVAPKWFDGLVRSIVRKFDLNKAVEQSSLSEVPVY